MDRSRIVFSFFFLMVLGAVAFMAGICFGSVNIPLFDVMKSLIGSDDAGTLHSAIVLEFRLPRTATATVAGASLAAAGLMMQTVFRNPLADPFVLGVNSGASLGVAIGLLVIVPGGIALASQTSLTGS